MSLVNMKAPKRCPECNEAAPFAFEWSVVLRANPAIAVNRLGLHDVTAYFVLGCEACSATVLELTAEEVAKLLTDGGF